VGGDEYNGTWYNDMMHGEGEYKWLASKESYKGQFANDEASGKGIYTFADGATFEGSFLKDQKHGRGIYTHPDGTKEIREYRFDKLLTSTSSLCLSRVLLTICRSPCTGTEAC
jgi:hypothetical protein